MSVCGPSSSEIAEKRASCGHRHYSLQWLLFFFTLVATSQFSIWLDTVNIIQQLESCFQANDDTVFYSQQFRQFLNEWSI